MIKFKIKNSQDNISILKNHILDVDLTKTVNYLETIQVPENTTGFEISYINNPGYQTYLTILIFLNDSHLYMYY
mgnify:CR=1 FL=1